MALSVSCEYTCFVPEMDGVDDTGTKKINAQYHPIFIFSSADAINPENQ